MGANMSRVHFIGGVCDGANHRSFDPARDMRDLSVQATAIGDVRLMILDPIVNAVGGDGHKSNDVRRDLAPIVDLASALDCAALGISHFTKGTAGKDPVERVTGSLAFGALARLVLAAAKIKEDDGNERRLLARAKSNIGPDGGGFSYVLEQCQVPGHPEISASRVMWGGAVDGTARELLADADAQGDPDGESPADVEDFVRGCLDRGPATAKSLMADANGAGYSWDQVKRAARRLDVEKRKEGMRGGWVWALRRGQNHEGRTEGGEEGTHKSLQPSHSSAPASVSMTDAEPPFLRDLEVF
jgi:putative DNA primase/helicase